MYRSERLLKDKISEPGRRQIEEALAAARDAIQGQDAATMKSATDQLNQAWQSVSAELYRSAQARRGQPGGTPGPGAQTQPSQDNVLDAEVVEEGEPKT